jgi:mRNA interferase RelE/StbE
MWKLEINNSSRQFLRSLDRDSRILIGRALDRFMSELNNSNQPMLSDVKSLKGRKGEFRLRVGRFRIIFTRDKTKDNDFLVIIVIRVGYRKDIYQG